MRVTMDHGKHTGTQVRWSPATVGGDDGQPGLHDRMRRRQDDNHGHHDRDVLARCYRAVYLAVSQVYPLAYDHCPTCLRL